MKTSIKLEYKDKVYTSDYIEMSVDEKSELTDLIKMSVECKVSHLTLKKENQNFYFGKKILEESIITIINES